MCPPMLEPMTICGPWLTWVKTLAASSSQRPMVPSVNEPPERPWPE